MMCVGSLAHATAIAIPNASFEGGVNNATDLDPDGWGVNGVDNDASSSNPDTRVSTDFAHEGVQSLKMDAVNSPQNREVVNPNYSANGDNTTPVNFTFWAYTRRQTRSRTRSSSA